MFLKHPSQWQISPNGFHHIAVFPQYLPSLIITFPYILKCYSSVQIASICSCHKMSVLATGAYASVTFKLWRI